MWAERGTDFIKADTELQTPIDMWETTRVVEQSKWVLVPHWHLLTPIDLPDVAGSWGSCTQINIYFQTMVNIGDAEGRNCNSQRRIIIVVSRLGSVGKKWLLSILNQTYVTLYFPFFLLQISFIWKDMVALVCAAKTSHTSAYFSLSLRHYLLRNTLKFHKNMLCFHFLHFSEEGIESQAK